MPNGFWQDLRSAARAFVAMQGGFLAVLTLAIGVGATTTMFAIVYAALLRPVPFADPGRLMMLSLVRSTPKTGASATRFSFAEYTLLSNRVTSFEAIAAVTRTSNVAVDIPGVLSPTPMSGEFVTAPYWAVLRIRPLVGRLTTDGDDGRRGTGAVAVISARLWRQYMDADVHAVGRTVHVNGVPLTVIGVLADGLTGLSERADVWMPSTVAPKLTYADYLTTPQHFIMVVGRLRPGVSVATANRELAVLGPQIANGGQPDDDPTAVWTATSTLLDDARIQPSVRRSALLLVGTIVCILLMTCANVASVLIARVQGRRREIAMRQALGATKWRIGRQLLTESACLCLVAGLVGSLLAVGGIRLIALVAPGSLPSTQTGYIQLSSFAAPALDSAVLAFAGVVTVAITLLLTLVPLEAIGAQTAGTLREDARTGSGRGRRTLHVIVGAEIAVAVVLVSCASLLVESARQLEHQRAGFNSTDVVTFRLDPPPSRYRPEDGPEILQRLLASVAQTPGIVFAAVNRCAPLDPGCARALLEQPGVTARPLVERHYISPDYFRALSIPVLAGRSIAATDDASAPPVTVINQTAARRFWPNQNPVGQHVWLSTPGFDDPARPVGIVGVVGDVKYGTIDERLGEDFYTSYLQFAYPDSMVIVKAAPGRSDFLWPALRQAVGRVDADLPLIEPRPLEAGVETAWVMPRFHAAVVVTFAVLALLLAAAGVFGVASVSVAARAHEMGIRVAVGAAARDVIGLVLAEHIRLGLVGGVVGLVAALATARLVQGVLYGVGATDPQALALALVGSLIAVVAGTFWPAWRAGAVNPLELLRRP